MNNQIVWCDIPVTDLDRAIKFYSAVLGQPVTKESHAGMTFRACLPARTASAAAFTNGGGNETWPLNGPLIYLNCDGRLDIAIAMVELNGGKVLKPKHQIGPYGFRAVIQDSEGNRIARCIRIEMNMSFSVPTAQLEAELNELVTHYPQKRSASLMFLHAIQEHFGFISKEAVEWTAAKLELQPINVYELVTFYPMFRQEPAGKYVLKVCRTLSCALGGSHKLHEHFCKKLGLDSHAHGLQTTKDGKFSVEFVECLASCGTAPVMMCNDDFYEGVSNQKADEILGQIATNED